MSYTHNKIAVIMINYKTYANRFLAEAYESFLKINYPSENFKLYIVDNVTSLETQQLIKELASESVVVPTEGNGWGHGYNIGIEAAIKDGYDDYFYVVNMDVLFDVNCLAEAVRIADSDTAIGIVQSKLLLHPAKDGEYMLNSKGNSLTFLGFGYCAGDGKHDDTTGEVTDIISAAGAGFLISKKVFLDAGKCDASYFMYHDDIELSQKVKIMGYRLVLAPSSVIYHKHEFGRAIMQIYFMELNRLRYLLEFYRLPTLVLILPAWLFMELGMLPYEIKGRWLMTKLKVYAWFFNPKNLIKLYSKRQQVQALRTISDKEFLNGVVAKIDFQQVDNPLLKYVANPIFSAYWWVAQKVIRW